jgi:hypothetical protein
LHDRNRIQTGRKVNSAEVLMRDSNRARALRARGCFSRNASGGWEEAFARLRGVAMIEGKNEATDSPANRGFRDSAAFCGVGTVNSAKRSQISGAPRAGKETKTNPTKGQIAQRAKRENREI